jgi:hypothetical protein
MLLPLTDQARARKDAIALLVVIGRMSGPVMQLQQGAQQFANVLPA